MSRTQLDLVLPATPVVPGVSSRLSLADAGHLDIVRQRGIRAEIDVGELTE